MRLSNGASSQAPVTSIHFLATVNSATPLDPLLTSDSEIPAQPGEVVHTPPGGGILVEPCHEQVCDLWVLGSTQLQITEKHLFGWAEHSLQRHQAKADQVICGKLSVMISSNVPGSADSHSPTGPALSSVQHSELCLELHVPTDLYDVHLELRNRFILSLLKHSPWATTNHSRQQISRSRWWGCQTEVTYPKILNFTNSHFFNSSTKLHFYFWELFTFLFLKRRNNDYRVIHELQDK